MNLEQWTQGVVQILNREGFTTEVSHNVPNLAVPNTKIRLTKWGVWTDSAGYTEVGVPWLTQTPASAAKYLMTKWENKLPSRLTTALRQGVVNPAPVVPKTTTNTLTTSNTVGIAVSQPVQASSSFSVAAETRRAPLIYDLGTNGNGVPSPMLPIPTNGGNMPVTRSLIPVSGFTNGGVPSITAGGSVLSDITGLIAGVTNLLPKLPLPGSSTAGQIGVSAGPAITKLPGAIIPALAKLKGPAKVFAVLTAAGLTADQISALISSGAVDITPKRRRRGISAAELRGFSRVTSLLYRVGMKPAKPRCRKRK